MTAPIVSVLGDVITLPALWLATGLIGVGLLTPVLGVVLSVVSVVGAVLSRGVGSLSLDSPSGTGAGYGAAHDESRRRSHSSAESTSRSCLRR